MGMSHRLLRPRASGSFSGGVLSAASIYDAALLMKVGQPISPTAGGTLTLNSTSLGSYDYTIRNGETLSAFTSADWFTSTADTRSAWCVVKGNLTINSGVTFIPPVRKLFTVLVVTGNLTLNGTISMTARGANHSGTGNSAGATTAAAIRIINGTYSGVTNPEVPAAGGALKDDGRTGALSNAAGLTGNAGSNGGTGGGGTGGYTTGGIRGYSTSGAGGTSFSGGAGAGGFTSSSGCSGSAANSAQASGRSDGGQGGTGASTTTLAGGGGAGNPGGASTTCGGGSGAGADGTGGVLIVLVLGTLSGTGAIVANGSAGGNSNTGGGGSGGGSVTVLSAADSSSITPAANGGSGGTGNFGAGGSGGAGTARKLAL